MPSISRVWLNKPRKVVQRRGTVASSHVRFVDDEVRDIASDNLFPVLIDYIPIITRAHEQDGAHHAEVCPEHLRPYLKIGSMSKKDKNETCNLAIAGPLKQNNVASSVAVECIDGNDVDGGASELVVQDNIVSDPVEAIDTPERLEGNQEYCPFSRSRNPPFARGGRRQSIAVMPTIPESKII